MVVPYHPDSQTYASRVWTKGMVVRTVDLMHASISDARATGP